MNAEDNSNMTSILIEGWFGSHHNIARSKENQPGIASGMLFELDFLTPVEAAPHIPDPAIREISIFFTLLRLSFIQIVLKGNLHKHSAKV